jgi:galactose-1-phosphate uridylyltransferase
MTHVKFEKQIQETRILSPLTGFTPQTQAVERRKDPLLDRWCRINVERANRPKSSGGDSSIPQLVESTAKNCPFCPDRIQTSTPKFPSDILPDGRLRVGEAVVVPNLFAFAQHHAVVVLTKKHFLPLDEFHPELILNGLKASLKYLEAVRASNPRVRYASINWNNLPTAAASMLHPHLQIIADEVPTLYLSEAIASSERYYEENGVSYWLDLIEAEYDLGERYIADFGGSSWLTSFCGMGNNEILGVLKASNLFELSESQLSDYSDGLSMMLKGYHKMGVQAFNLSLYSGALDVDTRGFSVHSRMISRPDVKSVYTADTGFMERLHDEIVVETMPEDVASRMREAISEQRAGKS